MEQERPFREAQARLNWVKTRQEVIEKQLRMRPGLPPQPPIEPVPVGEGNGSQSDGGQDEDRNGAIPRAESYYTARSYRTEYQRPGMPSPSQGWPDPPTYFGQGGIPDGNQYPRGGKPRESTNGPSPAGPPRPPSRQQGGPPGQFPLPPPSHFSIPPPGRPGGSGRGGLGGGDQDKPKKPE